MLLQVENTLRACRTLAVCLTLSLVLNANAFAADYPENRDYGTQGDFLAKRGTAFGRTADLGVVGPLLVNLPEGPGSTSDGIPYRSEDTVWDITDLTNPVMIRSLTCDNCYLGQPIGAHATVTRFDETRGYLYTRNGSPAEDGDWMTYDPAGVDSNSQAVSRNLYTRGREPFAYTLMFSPYFAHSFWNYGNAPGRLQQIRNADVLGDSTQDPDEYWLGEVVVEWDHLAETGVTGFGSWLGNLFVMASDQMSTGMAIYDMAGVRDGQRPRLLSVFNPTQTEPDGNRIGIGGYWVEPYGTNKMVWAARERVGVLPERHYPAIYVVDFSDPESPFLSCEIYFDQDQQSPHDGDASSDPMYVNFQDQYAFVDHFRVDLERCETAYADGQIDSTEFDQIVVRYNDIQNSCDGSQYFRPLGQVGIFGGYDWWETQAKIRVSGGELELNRWHTNQSGQGFNPLWRTPSGDYVITSRDMSVGDVLTNSATSQTYTITDLQRDESINEQGMCFYVIHDEPDTRPPFVSGHRPTANQTNYPIDGYIHLHIPETLRSESMVNALQVQELDASGNPVASVSFRHQFTHTGTWSIWPNSYLKQDTSYRVSVDGVQDFMGNTLSPYSFIFTTGNELPTNPDPDPGDETPAPSFPGTPYMPRQSSQLTCDDESQTNNIWAVNPDNDSVTIVDTSIDSTSFELSVSSQQELYLDYQNPTSATRVGAYVAITYRADDKVVFHDADTTYPVFAIDTGHGSQPVAAIEHGGDLLVATYGTGEVIRIDVASQQIMQRLAVGPTPRAMAMFDDRLLVTREISADQYGEVYDLRVGQELTLQRRIRINKVTVPDDIDHGSGVPNILSSIVINRDGTRAYVSAIKANTDRGLFRNGLPLDDDNTVRPMLVEIDLVNHRDANTQPSSRAGTVDFDNAADPTFVTYLVDGTTRVVAMQGNNLVFAENAQNNTAAQFLAGGAPQAMCATVRQLYVKNLTTRSVSAIDVAGFIHDGRNQPRIVTINTVQDELFTEVEKRGKQVFYHASMPAMGPEGYISCSGCHVDSGDDGRVWDMTALGEGLRNTLSLNGAMGTRFGALHWSSNFDEVQDFELQIEQLNKGVGLIDGVTFFGQSPLDEQTRGRSADLDALADYLASLGKRSVARSPHRTYTGQLTDAAQRGQAVFAAQGCASCHSGSAYRDGLSHDVGTIKSGSGSRLGGVLTSIRTPSLIELWQSAPYFHDGSAATLQDVLSAGSHAVNLTSDERADLIQFLLSIDRDLYIDDDQPFTP
ncbi:Ig-like domain-containing protein [Arenicella xantha]|uniref:DNA-binding beta-propeller fold protein YncE n=1 Tax=Arenicella xantha TaxID=644221 RepID=A0A395JNJ9_9GAMM|nr:Ig-like domain-containing protein [Arenicella xantha]RBP52883.1 DNA-binding beta-propeller fold protein YncE [Arenicella xantha]